MSSLHVQPFRTEWLVRRRRFPASQRVCRQVCGHVYQFSVTSPSISPVLTFTTWIWMYSGVMRALKNLLFRPLSICFQCAQKCADRLYREWFCSGSLRCEGNCREGSHHDRYYTICNWHNRHLQLVRNVCIFHSV